MNLPFVKKQPVFFFLISALLITACTKITTTDIGGSLLPPVDGVHTKEVFFDVISKNVKDTITRISTNDIHSLGYTNDPLFGTATANINLELKPTTFPFIFPAVKDSLFLDSVVMVLNYKGAYGDTSQNLSLRVFEIANDEDISFRADSIYPTNYALPVGRELTENYAAKTVEIKKLSIVDSTTSFKEPTINQIRIKLNSSYGDELLHKYDTLTAYKSDSDYSRYIKGYQIIAEKAGNSLMKIALTSTGNAADTNTKLALYFRYQSKDSALGKLTTAIRYFRCNSVSGASTNYIERNRSGSQVASYLPSSNANDDLIFVDANPGIYSRIEIPGLDTIANKVIHRAELIMEQVPDITSDKDNVFAPPNLFIAPYSQDSMKRFVLPNDVVLANGVYGSITNLFSFGAYPFKKIDPVTQRTIYAYSFDMSRYLQGIITRHETAYKDLILWAPLNEYIYSTSSFNLLAGIGTSAAPLNPPAGGRVRLGGGTNTIHKMRFHIVYSDIP